MRKIKLTFVTFIVIGIIFGISALAIYKFNFDKIYAEITNAEDYEYVQSTFDDVCNLIIIETNNFNVLVKENTESHEFRISYYKNKKLSLISEAFEEGVLYFKHTEKFALRFFNFTPSKFSRIVLEVPAIYNEDITLKNSNGSVEFTELIDVNNLKINAKNGSVKISNAGAKNLQIESTNGNIAINNFAGDLLNLKNKNGNANVSSSAFENVFSNVINGNSNFTLFGNQNEYKIELSAKNGKSTLNGKKFSGIINSDRISTIKLTSNNGNIKLKFAG